jgi:chemotaxis protein histidine kinase CheA
VKKLHLVGLATDQRSLIFSTRRGSQAGTFTVPVDDQLLQALRALEQIHDDDGGVAGASSGAGVVKVAAVKAVPEPESLEERIGRTKQESALSVRDIQARLRRGHRLDDVAAEAGVSPDWIARFAAPILAEQGSVIEELRNATFVAARKGRSGAPLAASVAQNLVERGAPDVGDVLEGGWSAQQLEGDEWLVRLRYHSRGRNQLAEWRLHRRSGDVHAVNRLAGQLAFVERATAVAVEPSTSAPSASPPPVKLTKAQKAARARQAARAREAAKRARATQAARAKKARAAEKTAAKKAVARAKAAAKAAKVREAAQAKRAAAKAAQAEKTAQARQKAAAKKAVAKAAAAKKAAAKKAATKKVEAKRPAAKRSPAKRPAAPKRPAKQATASKRVAASRPPSARRSAPRPTSAARASVPGRRQPAALGQAPRPGRPAPNGRAAPDREHAASGTPANRPAARRTNDPTSPASRRGEGARRAAPARDADAPRLRRTAWPPPSAVEREEAAPSPVGRRAASAATVAVAPAPAEQPGPAAAMRRRREPLRAER